MSEGAYDRHKHPLFWLLLVITLILTGWALMAAAAMAVPVIVAFFVAIAMAPLDAAIRSRLPRGARWLGHAISMLILILILGAFFAGIGLAARQVAQKFPGDFGDMGQQMIEQTAESEEEGSGAPGAGSAGDGQDGGSGSASEGGGEAAAGDEAGAAGTQGAAADLLERLGGFKGRLGELLREHGTGYAATVLNRTTGFLASLVLILFLALLLLIEAPHWRRKASTIFSDRKESQWMQAIEQTARNLRLFVVVKSVIGFITASLYVGWLAVMGLDLLIVWGVLTFLLSYIPVIGSIVAGVIPAAYAFFQLDLYWAVVTGLGLLVIEQVMGNYVEPRFLGRQLSLSSFIVLVSLLVWGWIWGIAGALLATPMLILILSVSAHVRPLRPLAVFLGEHGEESVRAVHADEEA